MQYILIFILTLSVNLRAEENQKINIINPESLLIETLNEISTGKLNKAIDKINILIEKFPNFKLAHLIHGDLLSAHSKNINNFGGSVQKTNPKQVNDLKKEAARRINNYLQHNKKFITQNLNVYLDKNNKYLIFVNVKNSRLYTFINNKGVLSYNSDHYISIGKNGYGKKVEGDKKTPLGTYFLQNKINRKLPDLYGNGAYKLNYPNAFDKILNYTGSGIWIHGTPKATYSRPPESSDGCIVLSNADLQIIGPILNTPNTPVIISDKNFYGPEAIKILNKEKILNAISSWRNDWSSKNFDSYINNYVKTATYNHEPFQQWAVRKKQVFARSRNIKIALDNISIYEYPGTGEEILLINFSQHYKSNLIDNTINKTQLWVKKKEDWKILYEGNFK